MRVWKALILVLLFSIVGVGVTQAVTDKGIPIFTDGRVNNWQIDEPVAIFCVFDRRFDKAVFQRIEVYSTARGNKVLEASAAQISEAGTAGNVVSGSGYSIDLLGTNHFQVSAPSGYTFSWKRGVLGC
jgi:hypothetical protein